MIAPQRTQGSGPEANIASEKELGLRRLMREMNKVLVAYSGGVDSTYLALIATQELAAGALCVIGLSPSVSEHQRIEAISTASAFDLNFEAVETSELLDPNYAANPSNRCYFCKSELYRKLGSIAHERGIDFVLDGTNADDLTDHRPGRTAAAESSVRSPLAELGFTKKEIRIRSLALGLPTWDKPASPCLASRIAYGVPVTIERLGKVERGEDFLRSRGFHEFRVRVHGDLARIEIARGELQRALNLESAGEIARAFRGFGFQYVTLDLEGFRSGGLNVANEHKTIQNYNLEK